MDETEAWKATVTREQARIEIGKHDVPGGFEAFLKEVGDRETYQGATVLRWLGY